MTHSTDDKPASVPAEGREDLTAQIDALMAEIDSSRQKLDDVVRAFDPTTTDPPADPAPGPNAAPKSPAPAAEDLSRAVDILLSTTSKPDAPPAPEPVAEPAPDASRPAEPAAAAVKPPPAPDPTPPPAPEHADTSDPQPAKPVPSAAAVQQAPSTEPLPPAPVKPAPAPTPPAPVAQPPAPAPAAAPAPAPAPSPPPTPSPIILLAARISAPLSRSPGMKRAAGLVAINTLILGSILWAYVAFVRPAGPAKAPAAAFDFAHGSLPEPPSPSAQAAPPKPKDQTPPADDKSKRKPAKKEPAKGQGSGH